ncbi:probable Mitochondrial group I intron splicing factor CCM1 [Zygosaccharomyces bailii]|nr:probable Mitochondrial group I intron splicing factor CCM1 [Zygosaccharomyces bailii]
MLWYKLAVCKRELRRFQNITVFRRMAILPAKASSRSKRRRIKDVTTGDLTLKDVDLQDEKALEFKVKQLQEFTRNLKEQIKLADSKAKKLDLEKQLKTSADEDSILADELFIKLNSQSSGNSPQIGRPNLSSVILSTQSPLPRKLAPAEIEKRINDVSFLQACLIDKSRQNWNAIISKLYDTKERLQGIKMSVLKGWLMQNVKGLSYENVEKLDEMFLDAVSGDIRKFNVSMYECLFQNLGNLSPSPAVEDKVTGKMKYLLERYDKSRDYEDSNITKMSQFILNSCLKYSSKMSSHDNMEYFLNKFNCDYGIKPNRKNFTTVLQFYTKMGSTKQAWDVFDTMKFLSRSHAPDVTTYNSVLHLCNKEKNYAKALDLYEEMLDNKLVPNLQTINIMARTMATASADNISSEGKADSLRLLGWKYIHTLEASSILNRYGTNYYFTLEAMMGLAASDGDVGLARALYFKYTTQKYKELVKHWEGQPDYQKIWHATLDPRLFNHLLLAYANFRSDKLPILLGYEKGIKLRRNILNSVDYAGRYESDDDIRVKLPMLPIIDMNQAWQIMSESRALWQFNLEFGGYFNLRNIPEGFNEEILEEMAAGSKNMEEFKFNILQLISQWKLKLVNHRILNHKTVTTFLTIPVRNGDEQEFLLRLKEFTFQQHELEDYIERVFSGLRSIEERSVSNSGDESNALREKGKPGDNLLYFSSMKHKILADSSTYELMMKAASAFQDIKLSSDTWKSRGEFRKTATFQQLDTAQRVESDSRFATLMVQFLTGQGLLTDALAIVMSSQRYIKWHYPMIKELHRSLLEIEDSKSVSILLEIVNKDSSKNLEHCD